MTPKEHAKIVEEVLRLAAPFSYVRLAGLTDVQMTFLAQNQDLLNRHALMVLESELELREYKRRRPYNALKTALARYDTQNYPLPLRGSKSGVSRAGLRNESQVQSSDAD
jgi:hypothetical protein